jgi:hypothetical protein
VARPSYITARDKEGRVPTCSASSGRLMEAERQVRLTRQIEGLGRHCNCCNIQPGDAPARGSSTLRPLSRPRYKCLAGTLQLRPGPLPAPTCSGPWLRPDAQSVDAGLERCFARLNACRKLIPGFRSSRAWKWS